MNADESGKHTTDARREGNDSGPSGNGGERANVPETVAADMTPAPSRSAVPSAPAVPLVRVEPLGCTFEAPPELTLLEAAAFAGIRLPRLCRNGTCRTCLCRVVSGETSFTIEWPGLSREEKAEGYVLSCVAVARTDLVLDVPDAELL